MIELSVDIINGDTHHEHGDKNIQHHSQLHKKGYFHHGNDAYRVNAVFQNDIAEALIKCVTARNDKEQAGK